MTPALESPEPMSASNQAYGGAKCEKERELFAYHDERAHEQNAHRCRKAEEQGGVGGTDHANYHYHKLSSPSIALLITLPHSCLLA
jgi:hypothetical protein